MKFDRTRVCGFENALYGMRNPKNSWDKIDSKFGFCSLNDVTNDMVILHKNNNICEYAIIGENDMKLAQTLIKAGSEHRKFLRQIQVEVTITAPLYWWKEFSTYKVGTVANSTSTMHKLANTPITKYCFEMDDFMGSCDHISLPYSFFDDYWEEHIGQLERLRKIYLETKDKRYWKELIRLLPESWLQKRTVTMNYENLLNMCSVGQRRFHKLTEWSKDFIYWARSLPYAQELCFEVEEKKYSIVSGGFDPLHKGHIELIKEAAKISKDGVIVIMNSDEWLQERKHQPLLQRESREAVLRSIKGVVDVIYDDFDVDGTVKVALSKIREKYPMAKLSFCNGGDRSEYKNVPECDLCESLGVDLCFGVGGREKIESSSSILEKYKKGEY